MPETQSKTCKHVQLLSFARRVFELLEFFAPSSAYVDSQITTAPPHVADFNGFLVLAVLRRQQLSCVSPAIVDPDAVILAKVDHAR